MDYSGRHFVWLDCKSHCSGLNPAAAKGELLRKIESLEAQITSVIPSVNEMRRLLKAYNFTNFKFAHSQSHSNYRLVRDNGEDVNQTLSEDEEKIICKSLLSWANDASHFADDNLYVEHPMDII